PLFESVIQTCQAYGTADQIMFVIGATQTEYIKRIRSIAPDHFFLVPGVGAQGGSLEAVCENGMNQEVGLLINSSRGIIYKSQGADFAEAARVSAQSLQTQMAGFL
ncbi:MAG: orotidine 5'-phosphate decarboxylase, partial [Saprospiraceae bacterium]|nr:orotidine 5'-phosphate decarboxylase [Saprospiraceae bacterium]